METLHIPFREQFASQKGEVATWDESKRNYVRTDGKLHYCQVGGDVECSYVLPGVTMQEYLDARADYIQRSKQQ